MTSPRRPVALVALAAAVVGAALLAAGTLVACGGPSSGAPTAGHDSGVPEGGSNAPDASEDSGTDGGAAPDAFAAGQQLVARPARFEGLTSDGYVVFSEATDGGGRVAEVIGLDGGGATTIATSTESGSTALAVVVSGPVVFAFTDRSAGQSTLTLWSSAAGVVSKGSAIRPRVGAASADGAYVAYMVHPSTDVANIVFGPIASSSPATLAAIDVPSGPCWQDADMAFVGTTNPRFVSFFCPNGTTAFTILSTDPADGGSVSLSTAAVAETFGGDVVVFQDSTGLLESTAADGSQAVTLATNAASFSLSTDQKSVVLQTTASEILASPVATAAPRIAAPTGTGLQLGPVSPDGNHVLFASTLADGGADQVALYTDVQMATLADDAGPTIRALVPSPTSCPACLYDSFTPDSTYAMALDPIDNSQAAGGTGPLHVFPVADGGADWRLGTNVYTVIALASGSGSGSRFLFVEATPDATLANGYAFELYSRALTATDSPVEIGRDVEALGIDPAVTTVVYSIPGDGNLAGIWTAPLE